MAVETPTRPASESFLDRHQLMAWMLGARPNTGVVRMPEFWALMFVISAVVCACAYASASAEPVNGMALTFFVAWLGAAVVWPLSALLGWKLAEFLAPLVFLVGAVGTVAIGVWSF